MLLIRLLACVTIFSAVLFAYLDRHNGITKLRYALPVLHDSLTVAREQSAVLTYEIEQFESPPHLMKLHSLPEYGHLKHPQLSEIVWVNAAPE